MAELGPKDRAINQIAVAFKERRRQWFRDLLSRLGVADADGARDAAPAPGRRRDSLALVRDDPTMARAAKDAATALLQGAGVRIAS